MRAVNARFHELKTDVAIKNLRSSTQPCSMMSALCPIRCGDGDGAIRMDWMSSSTGGRLQLSGSSQIDELELHLEDLGASQARDRGRHRRGVFEGIRKIYPDDQTPH